MKKLILYTDVFYGHVYDHETVNGIINQTGPLDDFKQVYHVLRYTFLNVYSTVTINIVNFPGGMQKTGILTKILFCCILFSKSGHGYWLSNHVVC